MHKRQMYHYPLSFPSDLLSGYITITVKSTVDMSRIEGHWEKIRDNGTFAAYAMIKGSSEYDTKEMSVFIDGVVSEAKELGIQTETPEEIERLKALWQTNGKAS